MKQLSILDKLKVVFDLTKSNMLFIFVIALLIFISILFVTVGKKDKKKKGKIVAAIYAIVLLAIIIIYNSTILDMYDSMMNNLFIIFYFPSISVYVGAIIATNIIMLVSLFSKKASKINKVVNTVVFFIMHYIMVLILNVVSTNHLNVFNSKELYKNTDIHSLIELSGNIFIIWIIYLVIYKIINNYLTKKKSVVVVEEVTEVTTKTTNKIPKYVKVLKNPVTIKQGSRFGDNVRIIEAPLTVKNIKTIKEEFMENVKAINAPIIIQRKQPVTSYDLFKEEFMSNIKSIKAPVVIKRDYSFGGIRAINSPITIKNEGTLKQDFIDNVKSIKAPIIIKKQEYNDIVTETEVDTKVEKVETYKPTSKINNVNIRPIFESITSHTRTRLNSNKEFDIKGLVGSNYLTTLKVLNQYKVKSRTTVEERIGNEKDHRRKLAELMNLCGNNI